MTRRVLMVSPHFPPDSSAATHRVRLLAPHLAGYGWEPTVVTVDRFEPTSTPLVTIPISRSWFPRPCG